MSRASLPSGSRRLDRLLSYIRDDITRLPLSAVPLVGALASVESSLPGWFRDWLMAELGRRVPLEIATPAAEAVMRIREFSRYAQMDFALSEIKAQYTLLLALDQVDSMYQAIDFMSQLGCRVEAVLESSETPCPSPKETGQ